MWLRFDDGGDGAKSNDVNAVRHHLLIWKLDMQDGENVRDGYGLWVFVQLWFGSS